MRINKTPKCDHCGKKKLILPTSVIPPMVGFELEDGMIINVCSDCMVKMGKMSEEEQGKFIDNMLEGKKHE